MPKVSYERARKLLSMILDAEGKIEEYFSYIEKNEYKPYFFVDKDEYERGRKILSQEFLWDKTDEGHDYWSNINDKYEEIIRVDTESVDPFVEVKHPPKAGCGLPHIEIGSNTWAFHQMVVEKKKLQHKDDDSDYYLCFKGGNHMEDNEGNDRDFDQLADYLDGWSIYEESDEE